ncbi:MAG: insulinase family protein [Bacteroidales bacterium]|nr:insulinase family protein [Bacteroidales bacterium]
MKSRLLLLSVFFLLLSSSLQSFAQNAPGSQDVKDAKHYKYVTVPGDPLNARIYTLDNGLKVYMTVYKNEPRIQAYVAVAAGSKNDPPETTGLAHYFEHMMFKGTPHFGTSDFSKEYPLIMTVDSLFEVYRTLTDDAERSAMYKIIDSVSFAASQYAIPNEYDKLMSTIGSKGTNAYTSLEQTVYIENIPSNQLENWAMIQADRFISPVLRGFHSELETIYEEKNMTMTSDPRKLFTAVMEGLFLKHPYGTQTTIGTQEHIKNPSMKNIRWFHSQYYVPNNMAIALSGDFNPDEAIVIIDKYFGGMKPVDFPKFTFEQEDPVTAPIEKTVWGPDAENVAIAFRLPGAASDAALKLSLFDMILSNSKAGLIDLNLVKAQKVLKASSGTYILKDYSVFFMFGTPKEGQTLEEVRDLLLAQIDIIKKGAFDDWLLPAIIQDFKMQEIKSYEENDSRAHAFVEAFTSGIEWTDYVQRTDKIASLKKQDIVNFANEYFNNNYVVVYKETGKDTSIQKIQKNKLTKLDMNRDNESEFLANVKASEVEDIEPVFVNFDKDIVKSKIKSDIPLHYMQNTENETFSMYYVFDMGSSNNVKLPYAIDYLPFVGTDKYTSDELSKEFYKLGCSFNVFNSDDQVYVKLSGLSESFEKGVELFEHVLANAKANDEAWTNFISDELKSRTDAKKNMQMVFGYLVSYGIYGENSPTTNILSEKELKSMSANDAIDIIHGLLSYKHRILFYGSQSEAELTEILNKLHNVPATLKDIPAEKEFEQLPTKENIIYWVDFDTPQSQILMLNRGEEGFNTKMNPTITLFNEYFGGSMNSVIFQEMREARSLAYTALSFYQSPDKKDDHYYILSYIACQYDKMTTAIDAFLELLNEMPESDNSFQLAKDGLIKQIRTNRTTRDDILWAYEGANKLGLSYDTDKDVYEQVPSMTMETLKQFQADHLRNKMYTYLIIGDKEQLPLKDLKKYGKVKEVKMEDIFGY